MSTDTATTLFSATVTDGPSAADIVNSLLYAYSPRKHPVHFIVDMDIANSAVGYQRGVEFEANIVSVTYESGSPGMLIIKFYVVSHTGWGLCEGFYNANRRTGTFAMKRLET